MMTKHNMVWIMMVDFFSTRFFELDLFGKKSINDLNKTWFHVVNDFDKESVVSVCMCVCVLWIDNWYKNKKDFFVWISQLFFLDHFCSYMFVFTSHWWWWSKNKNRIVFEKKDFDNFSSNIINWLTVYDHHFSWNDDDDDFSFHSFGWQPHYHYHWFQYWNLNPIRISMMMII